ncbi:MAG TPA: Gfo/Idh/MocA family oxidoreductase [Galbitalea sp.]|jgi:predicted dehydrogenase|nr:Gfo/Idh/MocA family oxidoreductase [Galbitalea sp.]
MANQGRRYLLVGAGSRASLYVDALIRRGSDSATLIAICDSNPVRAEYHLKRARAAGRTIQFVHPDDLERAISELKVDRVIVAAPDLMHAIFVERSLRAGADVVVEKPLTIDIEGVHRIAAAVAETQREVVVGFNYRYSPRNSAVKQLISSGAIGEVTSIHFEWMLDTVHGADYFRRWHREKINSGGLLVHKASHHFDLVNWWIADTPRSVFARGGLRFYGRENAQSRGLEVRPSRGTHDYPRFPFEMDLRDDDFERQLYLEAEAADGYIRDKDVFGSGITIEDTLSVLVDYSGGATMSYSLLAYSPWEGYRVAFNGTGGRLDLEVVERAESQLHEHSGSDATVESNVQSEKSVRDVGERLILQQHWGRARELMIEQAVGGHGGGDSALLSSLFDEKEPDPLGRQSDWVDGVRAAAVGIAGNRALDMQRAVLISELDLGVNLSRPSIGGRRHLP